jgi:1-acyl-sn-glycerol-3-phosphate acyltransferase
MAERRTVTSEAARNGHGKFEGAPGPDAGRSRDGTAPALAERVGAAAGALANAAGSVSAAGARAAGTLAGALAARVEDALTADLDDRDPDYIRENLPAVWLLSSLWFRGEVRNLGNIPEQGAALLVGNHSGGNLTPDTFLFTLAFYTYFGVERPFYQLAHNLVLASPVGPIFRKYGTVPASHEHAREALDAGAAVLVYPGGDWEVHRPVWERNRVDFGGRSGFVRLALDADVPIVPVVAIGGQETALFLSRGDRLARLLGLNRLLRLKVLPISLALPWGLNVGDFASHIPLPAKLTVEVLPQIDVKERFGEDPEPAEVRQYVERLMQDTLDALAAERRYPIIG